jgi:hypothetical protein
MKMGWVLLLIVPIMLFSFSGISNAALTTIGTANYLGIDYNLIYEDDQGLVWLDYTRGLGNWQNAVNWVSELGGNLTVTLNSGYTSNIDWQTGWRLPLTDETVINLNGGLGVHGPDSNGYYDYLFGYNMINGEMGHLYYESLGNMAYYAKDGTIRQEGDYGLQNTGPFSNLTADDNWSGTVFSDDTSDAWIFLFVNGWQGPTPKSASFMGALAVLPGQVSGPGIVPIPGAVWLLGSGLIALVGLRKKFRK